MAGEHQAHHSRRLRAERHPDRRSHAFFAVRVLNTPNRPTVASRGECAQSRGKDRPYRADASMVSSAADSGAARIRTRAHRAAQSSVRSRRMAPRSSFVAATSVPGSPAGRG